MALQVIKIKPNKSKKYRLKGATLDCLIIGSVAFLLYFIFLGSYPLTIPDEGRYSDIVRIMLQSGNYVTPLLNGIPFLDKPPLYFWIQTFFARLIGLNEWGLRLWPVIIAVIGCIATYLAGRRLFNRRTGWLGAIILGTNLLYFVMAHVANIDLTVAIFISISLLLSLIALEKTEQNTRYFYLAYLFAALAILTKGLIGIVFPAMIIGLWILILNQWKTIKQMHLFTGMLLIVVICAPWFILAEHENPGFLHYFFYTQQVYRYVATEFNSHYGAWFYPALILIGTLPWTFSVVPALIRKTKLTWQSPQRHRKQLFLLIWVISITVFFSIPISKPLSYILPVFPAIALITASYLDHQLGHKKQTYSILASVLIALCVYPAIMLTVTFEGEHLGLKSSKPLAMQLKKTLKKDDTVVFYNNYYQDLAFYLNHPVLIAGSFKKKPLKDDWRQDFAQGLKDKRHQNRMLNNRELQTISQQKKVSGQRIYVFVDDTHVQEFLSVVGGRAHLLGRYQSLQLFVI